METAGYLSDPRVGSLWRSLRDRAYSNVRANDKPVSGQITRAYPFTDRKHIQRNFPGGGD